MYREDYLLAKVEMDIDRARWFGTELPEEPQPPQEQASRERRGWLGRRREARARRRQYEQLRREYEIGVGKLETKIRQLAEEVPAAVERTDITGDVSCVYEAELSFLTGDEWLAGEWKRFWNIPEFRDYKEFRWVKPLLTQAEGPDFILLGTAPCIPLVLQHCARRMKSLHWYLREEDCTEEVQEFAEDFYIEYGLAITMQPLGGRNPFRTMGLKSKEPVCVLDFTEEEKIFAAELAEGSIWLDFSSAEEKGKRIRRLASGVRYDSLKQQWKRCRRESQIETNFTTSGNSEKTPLFL